MHTTLRNFVVGLAPIVLMALGAEVRAQATDVDCSKCVDSKDIAVKAVTTGKLQSESVTKDKIARSAVTTSRIKNGAVTISKVSPELSNSIGTFCAQGESVVGMDGNGNLVCEAARSAGTVAVFSAGGNDLTPDVPVVDQQLLWLEECTTPAYVAGAGETAIVSATVGLTIDLEMQGELVVASFESGVPSGHGAGYFWVGDTNWDITAVHHIDLTEGVEYQFGATIFPQGGGVTRSRLSCQTVAQIVRVTP
jgi:hypothetical protein